MTVTNISQKHNPAQFEQEIAKALAFDIATFCQHQGKLYRYALIDAGITGFASLEQFMAQYTLHSTALFLGTPEEPMVEIGPWLIEIPPLALPELYQQLAGLAATRHALSMISSRHSIQALSKCLRSWLDGELDDGTSVVIRYYDPRCGLMLIEQLPEMLPLLDGVHRWVSWGVDYAPICLTGKNLGLSHGKVPHRIGYENQLKIDAFNPYDAMLAMIQEEAEATGVLESIAPGLQRWVAYQHYQQAWQNGARQWADLYMWVYAALTITPGLHQYPEVSARIAENLKQGQSLLNLLLAISEKHQNTMKSYAPYHLWHLAEKLQKKALSRMQTSVAAHPFAQGKGSL